MGAILYEFEDLNSGAITKGDGTDELNQNLNAGEYILSVWPKGVNPQFNRISFESVREFVNSLLEVQQWGDVKWSSFAFAFSWCRNLQITATDIPNLSNVTDMQSAFEITAISAVPNINDWDVSKVKNMKKMFSNTAQFNQPIDNWDVSSVENMEGIFSFTAQFNQPIGNWDVSKVENMRNMFYGALSFNQDISDWDVSNVENMEAMFCSALSFNQPIGNWDVSKVKNMRSMFLEALFFNQDISDWDVSNVKNMSLMFRYTQTFNQPIGNWNVLNVENMSAMFSGSAFNQPIGNWDVSHVTDMSYMFLGAISFNQPIGDWDVSNLKRADDIFMDATSFNQNLEQWNLKSLVGSIGFPRTNMSCENYSKTLRGWASNPEIPSNIHLDANNLEYSLGVMSDREILTASKNWTIAGDKVGDCTIDDVSTGIEVNSSFDRGISLYPNPAMSEFFVSDLSGNEVLMLYDLNGKLLQSKIAANKLERMNTERLSSGLYLLKITSDEGESVTLKIIK